VNISIGQASYYKDYAHHFYATIVFDATSLSCTCYRTIVSHTNTRTAMPHLSNDG